MNKVYKKHCVDPHPENSLVVSRTDKLADAAVDEYEALVVTRWARRAGLLGDTQPLSALATK